MARGLRKRVVRAMTDALAQRDRVEMEAIDALLSLAKPPRRASSARRRRPPSRRRRS